MVALRPCCTTPCLGARELQQFHPATERWRMPMSSFSIVTSLPPPSKHPKDLCGWGWKRLRSQQCSGGHPSSDGWIVPLLSTVLVKSLGVWNYPGTILELPSAPPIPSSASALNSAGIRTPPTGIRRLRRREDTMQWSREPSNQQTAVWRGCAVRYEI